MNTPAHFRFLLDSVEFTARRTKAILHEDSRHFWDDIIEAYDRRDEKPNYWLFASRWLREELLKVMHRGSPRALLGILSVLRPGDMAGPDHSGSPTNLEKSRIVALLLPVLMAELGTRVRNASKERLGPYSPDEEVYHPEDLRE